MAAISSFRQLAGLMSTSSRDGQTWRGVQYPAVSVRVMEEDVFRQHPRFDQGDGGSKESTSIAMATSSL
jgi:hypothetical protein